MMKICHREHEIDLIEFFGENSTFFTKNRRHRKMMERTMILGNIFHERNLIIDVFPSKNSIFVEYKTYLDRSELDKDLKF